MVFKKDSTTKLQDINNFKPFSFIIFVDFETLKIEKYILNNKEFNYIEIRDQITKFITDLYYNYFNNELNSKNIHIPNKYLSTEVKTLNKNIFNLKNINYMYLTNDKQPQSIKDIKTFFNTITIYQIEEVPKLIEEFNLKYNQIINYLKNDNKILNKMNLGYSYSFSFA